MVRRWQTEVSKAVMAEGGTSLSRPLGSDNRGYALLQKMGWSEGRGLGKRGHGIVEPIPIAQPDGFLGLGKAAEYDRAAEDATDQRKALTAEVLLREADDAAAREVRQARNASELRIQSALKDEHAEFFCECCRKQYKDAMEWSNHLSSYDHHHKKRFKELQADEAARRRAERDAKEARRAAKLAALPSASAEPGGSSAAEAQPAPTRPAESQEPAQRPAPTPVVLSQEGAPLKFSMSKAAPAGRKSSALARPRPALSGFGAPE